LFILVKSRKDEKKTAAVTCHGGLCDKTLRIPHSQMAVMFAALWFGRTSPARGFLTMTHIAVGGQIDPKTMMRLEE
jgi:hypothetical protein